MNPTAYFWGRERIDAEAWETDFSFPEGRFDSAVPQARVLLRGGEERVCREVHYFRNHVSALVGPGVHDVYLFIPPGENTDELLAWMKMDDLSRAVWEVVMAEGQGVG